MDEIKNEEKKPSKIKRFFHAVFVNNFVYKVVAIVCGVAIWMLMVGF